MLNNNATCFRFKRQCLCLVSLYLFIPTLLFAQEPSFTADVSQQQALIFDPVLLQYVEEDPEARDEYRVRELSSLPSVINPESQLFEMSPLTPADALSDTPLQYQESILAFELDGGVYDARLSEAYLSLGSSYQQLNEHQLAIEAFNQALHVNRINQGLYNPGQLNIVSELVESYLSIGDFATANQQQEYLFFVQQKIYGPTHPIHIARLLEYADWNLQAGSLTLGYIPNAEAIGLRPFPQGNQSFERNIRNFDPQIEYQLTSAIKAYYQALRLERNKEELASNLDQNTLSQPESDNGFSQSSMNILETERKLAYTHFLLAKYYENFPNTVSMQDTNDFFLNFRDGQNALERRLYYLQETGGSSTDILKALADIGDWFILFQRWTSAQEIYIQVLALIESNNAEHIPGLAYPDLPETIPSYISNIYSRSSNNISTDEVLDYEGYIDVSFEVSRIGSVSNLEFLSQSEGTLEETERALMRMLRRAKFRLQLKEDDSYSDNAYLVRYYYTNQPLPEPE